MDQRETRSLLLTGATSGLGLGLAQRVVGTPGWHCVLPVRNAKRGEELTALLGDRAADGTESGDGANPGASAAQRRPWGLPSSMTHTGMVPTMSAGISLPASRMASTSTR